MQSSNLEKVLVVGAGLSGSIAAQTLHSAGLDVTVFDKARGAGGRLSTKRTPVGRFNFGAPDFRIKSELFGEQVIRWCSEGLLTHTEDQKGIRYRAPEAMNTLVKRVQRDLEIQYQTRVLGISFQEGVWRVETDRLGPTECTHLVLAIPAPQALELIPEVSPLHHRIARIEYTPSWVVMLAFESAIAAMPSGGIIGRITENEGGVCVYLTDDASNQYLESSADEIIERVCERFTEPPVFARAHRWRYSQVSRSIADAYLHDPPRQLTVCGDGFGGDGVEASFLSGQQAAQRLVHALSL